MLKKGSMTVHDYFLKIRAIADTLLSTGQSISDDELLLYILGGLSSDYDPVVVNLTLRQDSVSLQEAQFLLQSHEMRLDQLQTSMTLDVTNASANVAYNSYNNRGGRGFSGNRNHGGRGNSNHRGGRGGYHGRGRSNYKLTCQICKRIGHLATTCYFHFDNDYQPHAPSNNNQEHHNSTSGSFTPHANSNAYVATSDTIHDPAWYVDSGATSHVTADLDNLSINSEYKGKGKLYVGNGNSLTISHVGSSFIPTHNHSLALRNVLHVPKITKNLISVPQFTKDNNVIAEFFSDGCLIKDKETK